MPTITVCMSCLSLCTWPFGARAQALKLDWFTQPLTMDAATPVVAASRAKGGSSKQSVTVGGGAAVPRGGGNKGGQAVAAAASSEAPKASSFRQHDR
eukprot:4311986-Pleurochrysis_carterae.AAC.1